MRKIIATITIAAALTLTGAATASADPAFGPGNNGGGQGNSTPTGPADPKCHPPGQTVDVPGCK
jgi:hypothetical protein